MKVSKLSLLVLLIVVVSVISVNVAYGGTLANPLANPASTLSNKGTQYAIEFTTPSTPSSSSIKTIKITFPTGVDLTKARVVHVDNFSNLGTTSCDPSPCVASSTTLTYTLSSAQSVPANTKIFMFVAKVANPKVTGTMAENLDIATFNGSGVQLDNVMDVPFSIQSGWPPTLTVDETNKRVGIGTSTPTDTLTVNGTLKMVGATKILSSGDICIGSGC